MSLYIQYSFGTGRKKKIEEEEEKKALDLGCRHGHTAHDRPQALFQNHYKLFYCTLSKLKDIKGCTQELSAPLKFLWSILFEIKIGFA